MFLRRAAQVVARLAVGGTLLTLTGCVSRSQVTAPPVTLPADDATSTAVNVVGGDFGFAMATRSVDAGVVEFLFTNKGIEPHEMVIVPVDGDRYGLPIAEIEIIESGQSAVLRADLPRGAYALVCLVITADDSQPRSHMELGMFVEFEAG